MAPLPPDRKIRTKKKKVLEQEPADMEIDVRKEEIDNVQKRYALPLGSIAYFDLFNVPIRLLTIFTILNLGVLPASATRMTMRSHRLRIQILWMPPILASTAPPTAR